MSQSRRLEVSIDDQSLEVIEGKKVLRRFLVSTAARGVGFKEGSYRTPAGRFRIREKIGEGAAKGTIFKSRVPAGQWKPGQKSAEDLVLTRVLRLDGLDAGNRNSFDRFIYIHGTNREDQIGMPASHGCIRLKNDDMVELFSMVKEGMPLFINPPSRKRGKLMFIDCDSTLSSIEGIDELARARGPESFADVVALTNAAMNGEIPIHEVFPRRMEIIKPDRVLCDAVARRYLETIVPGASKLISVMKADGWIPVILSGGFAPLIEPLARHLGIDHVEAVPLWLNEDGSYAGYGKDYPTTRNLGKNEIIREWKQAVMPLRTIMIGDGVSDLETRTDVDCFIGYGGVVEREIVKDNALHWLENFRDISRLRKILAEDDK